MSFSSAKRFFGRLKYLPFPAACQARPEILPLQHPSEWILGGEADDLVTRELGEPFAVVADFGFVAVKDFEDLFEVSLGIGADLFSRQRRAGFGVGPWGAGPCWKKGQYGKFWLSHRLE